MLPDWAFSPSSHCWDWVVRFPGASWNNWIPKLKFSSLGRGAKTGRWGDFGLGEAGRCPRGGCWSSACWLEQRVHATPRLPTGLCVCECQLSCLTLSTHGLWPARLLGPRDFPSKNTGVGCHLLLQWGSFCVSWVSCIGRRILYYCAMSWHNNNNALSWCLSKLLSI